jgi:hypothetical protein
MKSQAETNIVLCIMSFQILYLSERFLFEWVYWNNYHTFRCMKRKLAAAIRQSKKGTAKRRRYPDTDPVFACYEYRMFFHIMVSVELVWWFTRTFWVSGHLKMRLCNPSTWAVAARHPRCLKIIGSHCHTVTLYKIYKIYSRESL